MPIITLTSDWAGGDFYLGNLKGRLLGLNKSLTVIDVNHFIKPFNAFQCAFVLKNFFPSFPENTIHLVLVNSVPSGSNHIRVIEYRNHIFIGSQSVLSLLVEEEIESGFRVEESKLDHALVKSGYMFMAELVNRKLENTLGEVSVSEPFRPAMLLQPAIDDDVITGNVIYIDAYQNAITNITRELFTRQRNGRDYNIFVKSNHNRIDTISDYYHDESPGELIAVFNSAGYLEIAMNYGNVAEILGLDQNSVVRINFKNKQKDKLF